MAGLERETPGVRRDGLILMVILLRRELKSDRKMIIKKSFIKLNGRTLRRYQRCSACIAAMLVSETHVKSPGMERHYVPVDYFQNKSAVKRPIPVHL